VGCRSRGARSGPRATWMTELQGSLPGVCVRLWSASTCTRARPRTRW
jgi:hypothetical protein